MTAVTYKIPSVSWRKYKFNSEENWSCNKSLAMRFEASGVNFVSRIFLQGAHFPYLLLNFSFVRINYN